MTYLILDLVVLVGVFVADILVFRTHIWRRGATWLIYCWLLLATFVFDTFLTSLPIVTYDATKLSGIYLGSIPIEDFGYTLALVIVVPMLWEVFRRADRI